jgi:hypothetical protein
MDYHGRVIDAEPPVVVSMPPNTSKLFLDSSVRDKQKDKHATNFESTLSTSGAGLKRITHRTIQWSQPLYTHNTESWELILSFDDDGFVQKYVYYMTPFVMFKEFSNPAAPYGLGTPAIYSYALMVQTALQTGARLIETPTVVEGVHGNNLQFRYSIDRGFTMYDTSGPPRVPFRIEPCSWLQRGHNIHGFGVREIPNNKTITMNPSAYANGTSLYFSDASPSLIYSRYLAISSHELSRNRKITSFNNTQNPALAAVEVNVIPTTRKNLGILHTYTTKEDPTVINLRYGDNIQFLRINITDEFGEDILTGSPLDECIYAGLDPGEEVVGMLQNNTMYTNGLINLILANPSFFNTRSNVKMPDSSIVHVFETTMI